MTLPNFSCRNNEGASTEKACPTHTTGKPKNTFKMFPHLKTVKRNAKLRNVFELQARGLKKFFNHPRLRPGLLSLRSFALG